MTGPLAKALEVIMRLQRAEKGINKKPTSRGLREAKCECLLNPHDRREVVVIGARRASFALGRLFFSLRSQQGTPRCGNPQPPNGLGKESPVVRTVSVTEKTGDEVEAGKNSMIMPMRAPTHPVRGAPRPSARARNPCQNLARHLRYSKGTAVTILYPFILHSKADGASRSRQSITQSSSCLVSVSTSI